MLKLTRMVIDINSEWFLWIWNYFSHKGINHHICIMKLIPTSCHIIREWWRILDYHGDTIKINSEYIGVTQSHYMHNIPVTSRMSQIVFYFLHSTSLLSFYTITRVVPWDPDRRRWLFSAVRGGIWTSHSPVLIKISADKRPLNQLKVKK